jgi:site-specific recombinase XerD
MSDNNIIVLGPAGDGFLVGIVPDFTQLLDDQLKVSGLGSGHSERAYRGDIIRFNKWRGERSITKSLVTEYLRHLSDNKKSPSYISRCLAAIRWYTRAIRDILYDNKDVKRLLSPERRAEILEQVDRALEAKKPRGERAAGIEKGRYIPLQEFEALIDVCLADDTYASLRDRAMLALAYSTGPRVHEVAGLKIKDVEKEGGEELKYTLRIIGKGNKERPIKPELVAGAAQYLQDWLLIRGAEPGALFCYITQPGKISDAKGVLSRKKTHLTTDALVKVLQKREREAGLEHHLCWHDFRRTYISDLIKQKGLIAAQKIIGHSSTNVTSIYDRTYRDTAAEVAHMRAIPYRAHDAIVHSVGKGQDSL